MEFKDIIEVLRVCPGYGTDNTMTAISNEITKEHKTHQANVVRNMLHILAELADSPTDPRNEKAVELCQKIKELDKFIPYI